MRVTTKLEQRSPFFRGILLSVSLKNLSMTASILIQKRKKKHNLICSVFLTITSLYMMRHLKHHFSPILAYHNKLLMKHFAVDSTIKTAEYKLLCISNETEVLSITQECLNSFTVLTVQALSLTVKRFPFGMMKTVLVLLKVYRLKQVRQHISLGSKRLFVFVNFLM